MDSGVAWDEDLEMNLSSQTSMPHIYRGSDGEWVWTVSNNRLALNDDLTTSGSDAYWNRDNGDGTWDLVLSGSSTDYIPYHVLATNDSKYPYVKVVGQSAYKSRSLCRDAIPGEIYKIRMGNLPSPEFIFLYSYIVRRNLDLEELEDESLLVDFRIGAKGGSSTGTTAKDLINLGDVSIDPASLATGDVVSWDATNDVFTNLTFTDTAEIDFTATASSVTAALKSGSIDESKLDSSVNDSLDKANSALQSTHLTNTLLATGNGSTTAYSINNDQLSVTVMLEGYVVGPSEYTATTTTVTFDTAPELNEQVYIIAHNG